MSDTRRLKIFTNWDNMRTCQSISTESRREESMIFIKDLLWIYNMNLPIILTMALNCRNYLNFPGHTTEVQISKEKRNIFSFHTQMSLKWGVPPSQNLKRTKFTSYLLCTCYVHDVTCSTYSVINPLYTVWLNRY